MNGQGIRRVAVIGGIRIPFCRAYTAYSRASNQYMMTAVLRALVATLASLPAALDTVAEQVTPAASQPGVPEEREQRTAKRRLGQPGVS